ncbi:DNA-directed RNA polymerase subunit RPC12/RpoP [Mycobacterium sp. MAA66]|uniref:hypothetical protein n=1 Tax=Mycobacterium sp. MAA66 TaxID=3156297 RepID=UPI003518FB71
MTVYEVLTLLVAVVLALGATAAIFAGLLNWAGGFFVVRCAACHHLAFSTVNKPKTACPHCKYPALLHPLYTAQHGTAVASTRVVRDGLRY